MAIVTGDLYKGFTFGGISSKAYGVYITQEAAYNAPDRDVEVVEIAGRNGAYILDKGRFKNITVSYKCGIALDSEHTFESAIRTFRNALSSKAGKYVRLEDDYNVNEYRQAAFLGGIEVDMADRRAGEFTVSFDAMPQRFLKSGETAVSVASGGTLTNPTLFESHPLLQVWGYGGITFPDGRYANIVSEEIGWVLLANSVSNLHDAFSEIENSNYKLMRSGGEIRLNRGSSVAFYVNSRNSAAFEITNFEAHFTASQIPDVFIGWSGGSTSKTIDVIVPEVSTTLESYYTKTVLIEATVGYRKITDGTTGTYTANFRVKLEYKHYPANGDTFSVSGSIVSSDGVGFIISVGTAKLSDIYGYSSA